MTAKRHKTVFTTEDFHAARKEAVFGALLNNYLFTKGYFVATPEPDLGEDLWIAQESGHEFIRAQLKSIHTATADEPRVVPKYNFNIQLRGLKEWIDKPGFAYIFGMTDDQFNGLAVGNIEQNDHIALLRVDPLRIIKDRPARGELDNSTTGSHEYNNFKTETRGFHFGFIPSTFFKNKWEKKWENDYKVWKAALEKWRKKDSDAPRPNEPRGPAWITVSGSLLEGFSYSLLKTDVTQYFGQIENGWKDSFSRKHRRSGAVTRSSSGKPVTKLIS